MLKQQIILCLSLILLSTSSAANTQQSLIETILSKRECIVEIQAYNQDIIGSKVRRSHQSGAGVILDSNGLIITNLHILRDKTYFRVTLKNGEKYSAKFIDLLPGSDLALIKITTPKKLKPIAITNSNTLKLKERIAHVGASHFIKNTISEGKITGLANGKKNKQDIEIIQVNLRLYEGDSGGPLFNTHGELIGLVTAQPRNSDTKVFAVPSNKIKKIYLKHKNELYNS